MAGTRRNYSDEEMEYAIQCAPSGEPKVAVAERTNIPYSTPCKWVKAVKDGEARQPRRRGPASLLPTEAEQSLFEWAVARQQTGVPVRRERLVPAISVALPFANYAYSQTPSRVRNNVTYEDAWALFGTLAKLTVEEALCSNRVFNVDETAFEMRKKSKKVVAVRGSKNVWTTEISTNFHLAIVACGSASGFVVPPVFIVPGKTVRLDVLDTCSEPGAAITTTKTGFMNSTLFETWVRFFANSVPSPIRRPLVLVVDGCSSHYSLPIVQAAHDVQVRLVCLPASATHLFQPLNVAVFGSFKAKLRALLNSFAGDGGAVSLSKAMALDLAGVAWRTCNFSTNVASGFRACGLFPLSLPRMTDRLSNFERNGTPKDVKIAEWLRVKETVQSDLLVLLVPREKTRLGRKTATVAGQLLTQELLKQLEDTEHAKTAQKRGPTAKTSKQHSKKSRKSLPSAEEKRLQHRAAQAGILEEAVV